MYKHTMNGMEAFERSLLTSRGCLAATATAFKTMKTNYKAISFPFNLCRCRPSQIQEIKIKMKERHTKNV